MGRLMWAAIAVSAASWSSSAAAQRMIDIPVYEGTVTPQNGERLTEMIGDNLDQVIGLRLAVEPTADGSSPFSVSATSDSEQYLLLSVYRPDEGGREILVNGEYRWEHGMWIVDGFFLVRSGGMHQGVLSYGLMPTDAAAVRLNPHLRLQTIEVR